MAPEQMTSGDTVGPSADIYSLAVIFYEMLMEFAPQGRFDPVSKSRPEVPKALDALLEKGMAGHRKSRYQSAADFERALDAALEPAAPEPDDDEVPPPYDPPKPPPRQPDPPPRPPDPPPPVNPDPPVRPDPPPPVRPDPPPPPPPPPPPRRGFWANLSPAAKKGVYAAGALSVIALYYAGSRPPPPEDSDNDGIIGSADLCPTIPGPPANNGCPDDPPPPPPDDDPDKDGVEGTDDLCPTVAGPASNDGCPVKRRQADERPVERWRDDSGNVYTVTRNGAGFDGSANNVVVNGINYGRVQMSGVVSPQGGNIVMTNPSGIVYSSPIGVAGPGSDPATTDAVFGTMRFHIDH
jgi:hypothetical protein